MNLVGAGGSRHNSVHKTLSNSDDFSNKNCVSFMLPSLPGQWLKLTKIYVLSPARQAFSCYSFCWETWTLDSSSSCSYHFCLVWKTGVVSAVGTWDVSAVGTWDVSAFFM